MGNSETTEKEDQEKVKIVDIDWEKQLDWEKIGQFNDVDTLIFQGGSVKGIAYVGAVQTLVNYNKDFLSKIKNVAGTSAGSITAFLIACGFDVNKIETIMNTTDFGSFVDMPGTYTQTVIQFASQAYVCEGKKFVEWVQRVLTQEFEQPMEPDVTFEQFRERTKKNLIVYAVRLNDSATIEFSAEKTPKVKVWLALRMSMSIPAFFKPVRVFMNGEGKDVDVVHDEEKGDTFFVDGGVKANYPYSQVVESLGLQDNLQRVLGFKILDQFDMHRYYHLGEKGYLKDPENFSDYSYKQVVKAISSMMALQDDVFYSMDEAGKLMRSRSICVFDANVGTLDFNLSEDAKSRLINSGLISVVNFFSKGERLEYGTKIESYDKLNAKNKVESLRDQFNKFKNNNKNFASYSFGRLNGCCSDFKKYFDFLFTLKNKYSHDSEIVNELDNLNNENTKFYEEMNEVLKNKKQQNVTLDITILKAENLPNKDYSYLGVSDPYCYITIDGKNKQTKPISDNLNPVWDENFVFDNVKSGTSLSLVIYDKDDFYYDDVLGSFEIPLENLKLGESKVYLQNTGTDSYLYFKVNRKN